MTSDLLQQLAAGAEIDRPLALVVAHPDDETVGLGSRLGRLPRLRIIYLTDGAPRDLDDARREGFGDWRTYAAARGWELAYALEALGAAGIERTGYGFPDQQAIGRLSSIVDRLERDLAGMDAVVTHPYEHGHPDHDTAALAVFLACRRLAASGDVPERFEFASYHLRDGRAIFGEFWDDRDRPETIIELDPGEWEAKRAAIECFRTQRGTLDAFPLSPERIRCAPDYDFAAPAPSGQALYDAWGWAMTSSRWREHAAAALAADAS